MEKFCTLVETKGKPIGVSQPLWMPYIRGEYPEKLQSRIEDLVSQRKLIFLVHKQSSSEQDQKEGDSPTTTKVND